MSCNLSSGRLLPCKDSQGGIKNVYFTNYNGLGDATLGSDDEITAFSGSSSVFKYELKGANALNENIVTSVDNGTTFVEQVLTIVLPKKSAADNKEFKLLVSGMVQVIIEDNNGAFSVMGLVNGADVSAGTASTGAAYGDMSGYTFTITAREPWMCPQYVDAVSFLDGFTVS